MASHRIVQVQSVFLGKHGQGGCREGLGIGRDGEEGVLVHRLHTAQLPAPVAPSQDRLSVFDDGHGQARNGPFLLDLTDPDIQLTEVRSLGLGRRGPEKGQDRQHQDAERAPGTAPGPTGTRSHGSGIFLHCLTPKREGKGNVACNHEFGGRWPQHRRKSLCFPARAFNLEASPHSLGLTDSRPKREGGSFP
mgnify:CR=1 FL=1